MYYQKPNGVHTVRMGKDLTLSPPEQKLIQTIRDIGWGEINKITVQNGQPMVIETKRTIKLNT